MDEKGRASLHDAVELGLLEPVKLLLKLAIVILCNF